MKNVAKKPWYKRWWAIALFVFLGLGIIGNLMGYEPSTAAQDSAVPQPQKSLDEYSVSQLKKQCEDLCTNGEDIPYIKVECRNACGQIYYYGGKEALIKEINERLNTSG